MMKFYYIMKIAKFDPIFFDSSDGKELIIQLLAPYKNEIEQKFKQPLETILSDQKLWTKMCTQFDQLPIQVYKILTSITEFGHERFRDEIIAILEPHIQKFDRNKSCQYLVANVLLHYPQGIKILEAKKILNTRRRFFKFYTTDKFPKQFNIDKFLQTILSAAITLTEHRTSLGESVNIIRADNLTNNC